MEHQEKEDENFQFLSAAEFDKLTTDQRVEYLRNAIEELDALKRQLRQFAKRKPQH